MEIPSKSHSGKKELRSKFDFLCLFPPKYGKSPPWLQNYTEQT